ncbi:MAG: imidazolonepropionase [Candidatus Lokiarchaeota archaeon]|nr:imidazolonepropionase [Candidatus Lokiarchaeota archaeon]MBD3199228.1 imidazolonepropionase [Candidatus Lokiarchaeota archaeon]
MVDLLIIKASQIATLNSVYGVPRIGNEMQELGLIHNGAIAIKDEIIMEVGETNKILSKYDVKNNESVIDASGKLITPGFVDPHTHIIFAGSRENELEMKLKGKTYLEILEDGGGILKSVRATRNASLDTLVQNGTQILDTMLKYGTTTVETKTGYGLTTEDEIKSLKTIRKLNQTHPIDVIATFMGAHAIPPEYKNHPEEYVRLIIKEMIPKVSEMKLAEFCDVFCEEGIFSIEESRRILKTGQKYELIPQIHIDEIVDTNGAQLAAELDVSQAGHLLKSNLKGLKAMAKKKIIATLLPGTPFCLMQNDYAPARSMINLGIPIALSTDLNPNCWTESMQMIITLACYEMGLTPAEALAASTLNSACALKRDNIIGSLEKGKKADINIFDVPNYQFLAYHFGVNLVSKVIKNGKIVVEN